MPHLVGFGRNHLQFTEPSWRYLHIIPSGSRGLKVRKHKWSIGLEILGEIDAQFRFKMHSSTAVKEGTLFTLVRSDFQSDGSQSERASQRGWRIEAPDQKIWLVRDAALRY
jgi:hypothetical protein